MDLKNLRAVQSIAAIVASIAVPLLVAFFGWLIQSHISSASVRKDYVQMAIGILAQPATQQNEELSTWAVTLLDANSDVPFSKKARAELAEGRITVVAGIPKELLDGPLMHPVNRGFLCPNRGLCRWGKF